MKKIGFIDYYIGNWHSKNYPAWIEEACKTLNLDYKICYAYAAVDHDPKAPDGMTTAEWCEQFGVQQCDTPEEVIEKSDYLFVLSPNNPEQHEKLCELPLKSGKPTYVDKTFAPDGAAAKRIAALAEKYNTPMFSSSALRFSDEIQDFYPKYPSSEIETLNIQGGGVFEIYIIHQIEMAVAVMGAGAKRVKCFKAGEHARTFIIEYSGGRMVTLTQSTSLDFKLAVTNKDGTGEKINPQTRMFQNLILEICRMFDTKVIPVSHDQTVECICLRDAIIKAHNAPDTWVDVVIPE